MGAKPETGREGHGQAGGFSLIELLIVIAIILVIAAIALPNFMRSRMAANESSAASNLRTLVTSAVTYSSTYSNGFPPSLLTLGGTGAAATCDFALLIDQILAAGQKSGYNYSYVGANPIAAPPAGCAAAGFNSYVVAAWPANVGQTGRRSFCSDQSGVVRFDPTGANLSGNCPNTLTPLQ